MHTPNNYSPYTILWKLPFCISPFLKLVQQNVIIPFFCIPKVLKSATKILKIGQQIKNLTPKNDLDQVFYIFKGGNPNVFKSKILAYLGALFKRFELLTSINHI